MRYPITMNTDNLDMTAVKAIGLLVCFGVFAAIAMHDFGRFVGEDIVTGVDGAPVKRCTYSQGGKKITTRIPLEESCPHVFRVG